MSIKSKIREWLGIDNSELGELHEANRRQALENERLRTTLKRIDKELAEHGLAACKGRITDNNRPGNGDQSLAAACARFKKERQAREQEKLANLAKGNREGSKHFSDRAEAIRKANDTFNRGKV